MEPQQSSLYADYIKQLGWSVIILDRVQIFLRNIPITGTLAKIHRPEHLPKLSKLLPILERHHVKTLAVEPLQTQNPDEFTAWIKELSAHVRINRSPFLPTKTIVVDLQQKEENIFSAFSEAKRRGVRRAMKHDVVIRESSKIDDLIKIKNKSAGFLGFITTHGIKNLWQIFAPKHAAILLAYSQTNQLVGGVLILFWDRVAYYWIAGASREGKKLFAPTLLVWEALLLSKRRGCTSFDFVGAWDERMPKENTAWIGFTKFKEGFGGKTIYYPIFSSEH